MADQILILFFIILVGSFILERYLDFLNIRHTIIKLPGEVADVFNADEYAKSQSYKRANTIFSFYTESFSLLLILAALLLGFFGWLDSYLASKTGSYYILVLFFFGILSFASDFLSIPFQLWDTFKIEEKYGFNKTTLKTFIFDKLKSWMVMIIIGGGILLLITWLYQVTGKYFWILAWLAISIFSLLMNMFYSNLIVPLFNKQKALEDGELRNAIEKFATKVGYNLKNIYVIDGSKRSTKANAYFSGLGPKKRIVLYDTLINDLSEDEIIAVLAHEIGHYKKKHTTQGLVLSIVQTGIMLFLFSKFVSIPALSQALGGQTASFHIGLIAFGILYSPLSMLLGILSNKISRKNEYEADAYASENHKKDAMISGLKKLSKNNLTNLTPHSAYVFFHYSHPTLLQRIKAINKGIN